MYFINTYIKNEKRPKSSDTKYPCTCCLNINVCWQCVHIYPIMAKIHPVFLFESLKIISPFSNESILSFLSVWRPHGRRAAPTIVDWQGCLTLDPPWVSWQQQCCQFEDFVAKFSYFLIVAANFIDFFATRSYFCYIEIKIVIYFGDFYFYFATLQARDLSRCSQSCQ